MSALPKDLAQPAATLKSTRGIKDYSGPGKPLGLLTQLWQWVAIQPLRPALWFMSKRIERWWVRNTPNMLSFSRLFATPLVGWYLWTYDSGTARIWQLVVIALVAYTDTADGILATKLQLQSDLGKGIDPAADKFYFACLGLLLAGHLGDSRVTILVCTMVAADLVLVATGLAVKRRADAKHCSPDGSNLYGKWKFGAEFGAVMVGWFWLNRSQAITGTIALLLAALVLAVWSFEGYWRQYQDLGRLPDHLADR